MEKVRVVFLPAIPAGSSQGLLEEEVRAIDASIQSAEYRDRLQLISRWAVRLEDLSGLMLRDRPQVIHLSGRIVPEKLKELPPPPSPSIPAAGSGIPMGPDGTHVCLGIVLLEGLVRLLRVLTDDVRVVVLNACYAESQAESIVEIIPCVVGTDPSLRHEHALAFVAEFYMTLAYGRSIQESFDVAVVRLQNAGYTDAEKLVRLHSGKGIDPDQVFLIVPQSAAPVLQPQLSPAARRTLVHNLGRLGSADWALMVAMIDGAESRVSRLGTVPEQVAELMRWAGSPIGPGLAAVEEAYQQLQSP